MPRVRPSVLYTMPTWKGSSLPSREAVAKSLLCPFPEVTNPNVVSAHVHALDWLDRFTVHSEPSWVPRAKRARMTWMVAGFYPTCDLPRLCIATDYLSWAFGLDDVGDETETGERPERLLELFGRFDDVFAGRGGGGSPQAEALDDVVARLANVATGDQLEAFAAGNRAYFGAMLWEANNRHGGMVPEEGMYMMLRPAAGAVPPFFAMVEPLEGIHLTDELRNHPGIANLVRLAGGIVCWTNDVLSYEKERARGDVHNLAYVYEHHRGLSPGRALAEAVGFNNASVADFIEEQERLPSFGAAQDAEVKRYVATLRSMIRVTLDWTLGSPRYSESELST